MNCKMIWNELFAQAKAAQNEPETLFRRSRSANQLNVRNSESPEVRDPNLSLSISN